MRTIVATGGERAPALRATLERDGLEVVATVAGAREAVPAMVRAGARACVLDADVPGDLDWAVRALRAAMPGAVIVLLAERAADDEITDALSAGASGFLSGPSAADGVAAAVTLALTGQVAVPMPVALMLSRRARWLRPQALPAADVDLSPREREVVEALLDGASTAEVAAALGLSAVTVRRHVSNAMRKLGGSSREALLLASHGAEPAAPTAPAALSDRELQVLRLAAAGRGNRAIADELYITPSTVKNHLSRIMTKLGASNRTEAAVLAARRGDL